MSLALKGAYPEGVRPDPLPLRFYTAMNSGTHATLRVSVSILTSGESAGSPITVYTDGSFSPENGLSGGCMVIFSGADELYASHYQLGYQTSSFEAEMYTLFRAIGDVVDTQDSPNYTHRLNFALDPCRSYISLAIHISRARLNSI